MNKSLALLALPFAIAIAACGPTGTVTTTLQDGAKTLPPPIPVTGTSTTAAIPTTTTTTTASGFVTTTSKPVVATTTAPPRRVVAITSCAAAIAAVEAKGLYPAPGYSVACPGYSLGHMGMTCAWGPSCHKLIAITLVKPYVVANEFSNSRCFAGLPGCYGIDGGGAALGFQRPW